MADPHGEPKCHFCGAAIPEPIEECWCFGCDHFICEDMDCRGNANTNMPFGRHPVELHAVETDA